MKQYGMRVFLVLLLAALGGCGESDNSVFQGYVEGEYVYLASSRSGRLDKLLTERGNIVETGTPLFELEADHERHVVRQAEHELLSAMAQLSDMKTGKRPEEIAVTEAQLDQAKAEAANAMALLHRREKLIAIGGISKQELDDSRAAAKTATARVTELARQVKVHSLPEREKRIEAQQASVKAAEARVAQAYWELEQKRLTAPTSGLVYDTLFRQGEWVSAGNPVIQLLPPENVKIRFFVPEPLIGRIRLGGRVRVTIDGRETPLSVNISYVAANAEYTPPIIYSNETRSKLVFMVEARPELAAAASLHPGQPVSVSLP